MIPTFLERSSFSLTSQRKRRLISWFYLYRAGTVDIPMTKALFFFNRDKSQQVRFLSLCQMPKKFCPVIKSLVPLIKVSKIKELDIIKLCIKAPISTKYRLSNSSTQAGESVLNLAPKRNKTKIYTNICKSVSFLYQGLCGGKEHLTNVTLNH